MNIEVLKVTWEVDERLEELEHICQGCSNENLQQILSKYVVENIEPVGWKAIWSSSGKLAHLSKHLHYPVDFLVEVKDVSLDKLEAEIYTLEIVQSSDKDHELSKEDVLNKNLVVPLLELYPLTEQENKEINIELTAEVLDQIRFFYSDIWLPWDGYEEECFYNSELISERIKVYKEKSSGFISDDISNQMNTLIKRGSQIHNEVCSLQAKSDIIFEDLDERDVLQLSKLHAEMDHIELAYNSLKNPTLRALSDHQHQLERRRLFSFNCEANVLLVCDTAVDVFANAIIKIKSFIKDLSPSIPENFRIQTFPSLQLALDFCKVGHIVALLEGNYSFSNLGGLSGGGSICCINGTAEISTTKNTGDVLLDLSMEEENVFRLHSVTLKNNKIGIVVHKGKLELVNSSIVGGNLGLSLLNGSECSMKNTYLNCANSIYCAEDASLFMDSSKIMEYHDGTISAEKGSKIKITNSFPLELEKIFAYVNPS